MVDEVVMMDEDVVNKQVMKLRFLSAAISDSDDLLSYDGATDGLVYILDNIADSLQALMTGVKVEV